VSVIRIICPARREPRSHLSAEGCEVLVRELRVCSHYQHLVPDSDRSEEIGEAPNASDGAGTRAFTMALILGTNSYWVEHGARSVHSLLHCDEEAFVKQRVLQQRSDNLKLFAAETRL
jgi:hypothetical protein